MREIKFRALDTLKDRYLDWEEIISGFNMACVFDGSGFDEEKPRFIPEQFTGLKDKNGKEIYEGDIVKTTYNKKYDFAYYRVVMDTEKGAWWLRRVALHELDGDFIDISHGGYCETYLSNMDGEVIGNIHENPELLERKS